MHSPRPPAPTMQVPLEAAMQQPGALAAAARGAMAVSTAGAARGGMAGSTPGAARGGMAGPQGPTARGARILSSSMSGPAAAAQHDIFSAMATLSADTLVAPPENIQTDANSLRAFTTKLEQLSADAAQIWKKGVELLLSQPPGPREVMQKIQTYFGIKPVEIDMCTKMIGLRRVDLTEHDMATRRNRSLAVVALGLYARAQATSILGIEKSDPKLHRTCTQRLRDAMAKGSVHAQLVLNLMKDIRPMPRI